jgi:hypothetical protein
MKIAEEGKGAGGEGGGEVEGTVIGSHRRRGQGRPGSKRLGRGESVGGIPLAPRDDTSISRILLDWASRSVRSRARTLRPLLRKSPRRSLSRICRAVPLHDATEFDLI